MEIIVISIGAKHSRALELFRRGQEQGWLSYDEVLGMFPDPRRHAEELDALYVELAKFNIPVIDLNASSGDRAEVFTRLYQRYWAFVFSRALDVLRDRGLSEEVAHDVFLTIWKSELVFVSHQNTMAWLGVATRNRAIDVIRKRSFQPEILEEHSGGYTIDDVLITRVDVDNVLPKLPVLQREVIDLAYYNGLPLVDVARQLNESPNTIYSRNRLALARLKEAEGQSANLIGY
jgi:RNA polymerase sigma-70 factor (ECF subfamily)